jgi:hypothetical protein
MANM